MKKSHWVLCFNREKTLETTNGYIVRIKMELWQISQPSYNQEFPKGYKFSWIACNVKNTSERILFDNHTGKSPHIHTNGHEEYFGWTSLTESKKLFFSKVWQRFGHFDDKITKL